MCSVRRVVGINGGVDVLIGLGLGVCVHRRALGFRQLAIRIQCCHAAGSTGLFCFQIAGFIVRHAGYSDVHISVCHGYSSFGFSP